MENFTRTRDFVSVFGINHECGDLETRQRFYLLESEYDAFLTTLREQNIDNAFVLNTCNRTEVYCTSNHLPKVLQLYRTLKNLDNETLHISLFIKNDREAVEHFLKVGAGLNSKILGDYQIIGQIRTAYNEAKDRGLISNRFERLFQVLFKTSKAIKSQTGFNSGAASHGYVVANLVNQKSHDQHDSILILGAGDMARRTFSHLRDYCPLPITLANRTLGKLAEFEGNEGVALHNLEHLTQLVANHTVIVNTIPVTDWLTPEELIQIEGKLVFDLAVPSTFANALGQSKNQVFGIDQIEQITQEAVAEREKYIPQVTHIIEQHLIEYEDYCRKSAEKTIFRQFESDLNAFLNTFSQSETEYRDLELFSKKVTQLFMKRFYAESIKADSMGLAG